MAFRSLAQLALSRKWEQIKENERVLSAHTLDLSSAPSLTRKQVLDYASFLADRLAAFDALTVNANTNGLLEYARQQEHDDTYDPVPPYQAMRAQLVATQDWIVANFPATGGELQVFVFDANKRFAHILLTAGQLSSFKVQLAALSATID